MINTNLFKSLIVKTINRVLTIDVTPRNLEKTALAYASLSPSPFWLTGKNSRYLLS